LENPARLDRFRVIIAQADRIKPVTGGIDNIRLMLLASKAFAMMNDTAVEPA
jgi:hypothetical protein